MISRRAKDTNTELDIVKHAFLHSSKLDAKAMENWILNMQVVCVIPYPLYKYSSVNYGLNSVFDPIRKLLYTKGIIIYIAF